MTIQQQTVQPQTLLRMHIQKFDQDLHCLPDQKNRIITVYKAFIHIAIQYN